MPKRPGLGKGLDLLAQFDDAGIEPRGVAIHPALDLAPIRQPPGIAPGELAKELQHVLEKGGLGATGAAVDGEPDELDGIAHRQLAPQVEIFDLESRVL